MSDPRPETAEQGDALSEREEQRELAAAGRLSSAPLDETAEALNADAHTRAGGTDADGAQAGAGDGTGAAAVVGIGFVGWLRWGWRQLTSMRIALVLLFLLSLAAVPGSLIPQTSASPANVQTWHKAHPGWAPLFDKLDMFSVYSSFWFSAIYLLLFISLVGCIIPRTWQFVGVLRAKPPTAPRHLSRLPVYATWRSSADPDAVLAESRRLLGRRRFRVAAQGSAVSSEKGYLREVGNLLFHISLVAMLIAFAFTKLAGGMGTVIVVEGDTFSNNVTQYDDFEPSAFYTADSLKPFHFRLDSFKATWQTSGSQVGTARTFAANVTYWNGASDKKPTKGTIEVNHPLEIGGSNVYLTAHGYAPVLQVTNAKGEVIFNGPTACLPQDSNITSMCAFKISDGYVDSSGKSTQVGLTAIFAPTMAAESTFNTQGPHSIFPDLLNPELALSAYYGDLGNNAGDPQSVYELDTTHMKPYMVTNTQGKAEQLKVLLQPGQHFNLPSGGTVTMTGIKQWVNFTVSSNPGTTEALVSAALAILGLIGSLFVQRRRIWVRAVAGPDGTTTVELAGLARSESSRIAEELAEVALALQDVAPADRDDASDADDTVADGQSEDPELTSTSLSKER
ncbi:cytochrome c biogenesis protein ResB [Streptacidiphilus sp. N1-3]|uniref:Cytochrome c biogenesis protein ResB n=1 Tax=Streptacidiphilus alkalitolerans TaxID=3342712 RepID=A0ABV6XA77_9ACTN